MLSQVDKKSACTRKRTQSRRSRLQLSNITYSWPGWLKYSSVVYLLSIVPYWLMFRSVDAESAWGYLVGLAPGLAPLMLGLVTKHHLKYIAWWFGEMRFWLIALSLPPLIEIVTIILTVFLQLGKFNSTIIPIDTKLAASMAIRMAFDLGEANFWVVVFDLFMGCALASVFHFPLAVAEELGWRGTLFPQCANRFGFLKGAVLVGLIWGVWQTPATIMRNRG